MLHDRQQLDVGEAVRQTVIGNRVGQVAVVREALPFGDGAPPRTEVHLVDRHRRIEPLALATRRHPVAVAPRVIEVGNDRIGRRRSVVGRADRVALVDPVT